MGFAFEGLGVPRAAGRILGWLTLCNPPEQSAVELQEALSLSASTVSTMSRLLLEWSFIEKVARPRERRRFFRARAGGWLSASQHELEIWRVLMPPIEKLCNQIGSAEETENERLYELRAYIEFVERELPLLFARFEQEQIAKKKRSE